MTRVGLAIVLPTLPIVLLTAGCCAGPATAPPAPARPPASAQARPPAPTPARPPAPVPPLPIVDPDFVASRSGQLRLDPRSVDELWDQLLAAGLEPPVRLPEDDRALGTELRELGGRERYLCTDLLPFPMTSSHGPAYLPISAETLRALVRRMLPDAAPEHVGWAGPTCLFVQGNAHEQARVRELLQRLRALLYGAS